jgi:hypothetical protein
MRNNKQAEVHVLDRLMYLLEERSVRQLAARDESFEVYVSELYQSLQGRAQMLQVQPQSGNA